MNSSINDIRDLLGPPFAQQAFDRGEAIVDGQGPLEVSPANVLEEVAMRAQQWDRVAGGACKERSAEVLGIFATVCQQREESEKELSLAEIGDAWGGSE